MPHDDELSAALSGVADVLARSSERVEVVAARSRELLAGRAAGTSYAELLAGASGPLVLDVLSELQDALSAAGSHLRRVEVRALHAEGLSMDKIARLLRVSRQRVSAVINSPIESARELPLGADHGRLAGLSLTDPEFHLIAEALPYLVWVSAADGRTEYRNRRMTAYTGLPPAAIEPARWVDVVHPDDRESAVSTWQEATESGTVFERDLRLRRFDAVFRMHRACSLPVRGTHDEIVKWIGTAIDIEDRLCPVCRVREQA